jgi:hypothetical protein
MTMPWQAEMEGGWDAARAAFVAQGGVLAAASIAEYMGLDLSEPIDARIADTAYCGLLVTRCRVRLGRRSATFSWPNDGEAGTPCWLYPVYDDDANLVEVLAFDAEGAEHDVYSYGEAITALGLDARGIERRRVLFTRPRGWLRYWVKQMRHGDGAAARLHASAPQFHAALIVRPNVIDWSPVRRERAAWAYGVTEVVVADQDLGARIKRAFEAAARNALPELKLVSQATGGQG